MVDKTELNEQLRKLKKKIEADPKVKAIYDLDGDGRISGEEWEKARQSVIAFMEARAALAGGEHGAVREENGVEPADKAFHEVHGTLGKYEEEGMTPLMTAPQIIVEQQVEGIELVSDFEGRNRYKLYAANGRQLAQAEESDTGVAGTVVRNIFGTRRPFVMGISVLDSPDIIWLKRRFEFIFSRIDVYADEEPIGTVNQRFGLLNRRYELQPVMGSRTMTIAGPLYKPWTFYVRTGDRQLGIIQKNWSGLLKEAFSRADTFTISYEQQDLTKIERTLIVAAAIAIDIDYFERKK